MSPSLRHTPYLHDGTFRQLLIKKRQALDENRTPGFLLRDRVCQVVAFAGDHRLCRGCELYRPKMARQ